MFFLIFSCKKADFKVSKASFSNEYITAHNAKYSVEIPEVQELVHIIIALTEEGKINPDFVDRSSAYYQQVMKYFGAYDDERIVKLFNDTLRGNSQMSGLWCVCTL